MSSPAPAPAQAHTKAASTLSDAFRLHQSGNLAEAEAMYRKILRTEPRNGDAWHLLGVACLQRQDLAEAERAIRTAVGIVKAPGYLANLGVVLRGLGRSAEAVDTYREALRLTPDVPALHYNLGIALMELGRPEEAVAAYRAALDRQPIHPEALNNLGIALNALGRFGEAAEAFRRALEQRPSHTEATYNLGIALHEQGRLDEALAAFRSALGQDPARPEIHNNLGLALHDSGQVAQAADAYRAALQTGRDLPEAHHNLSLTLLLRGDFQQGWEEYEWRWLRREAAGARRVFDCPLWAGELSDGKTILLHAEQGLGDSIQFVRYVPMVLARGWRVILEVPRALLGLFGVIEGVTLVAAGEPLPPFDAHCPLLSLPRAFGTTLSSVPAAIPYLRADAGRVAAWPDRLPRYGFRVGIAWQGNPTGKIDRGRSFPLAALAPIARVPGVRLVSLQKNDGEVQLRHLPDGMVVNSLGPAFDHGPDAFLDTAAVMDSLDLVITCDTAVAHLAGALGRPAWVALKAVPDWRWMLEREDSPWYPTLRLFRQTTPGDWDGLFARMAVELARIVD